MPSAGKLTIATCQHPIEPEIRRNLTHILELMRTSRERGADIAHFPECNLSGYAGEEFEEINRADLKNPSVHNRDQVLHLFQKFPPYP